MVKFWKHAQRDGYKWAVDLAKVSNQQKAYEWCYTTFGKNNHMVTWKHSPMDYSSMVMPETWLFTNHEDAVLFALSWGYDE